MAGIAFIVTSFSLPHTVAVRNIVGSIIVIIAGLMLIENISSTNLGIDLPSIHGWFGDANPYPGRMAPNTALAFLVGGIALLRTGNNFYIRPRAFAAIMLTISILGMLGYLFLLDLAYTWYGFPRMAFTTGIGVSLFAWALLIERPELNSRIKSESDIYAFLGIAVTVLITTMFVSYGSIRALDARNNWVEHTYEVKLAFSEITSLRLQAQRALNHQEFDEITSAIQKYLDELKNLTKDNPTQKNRLAQIIRLLDQQFSSVRQSLPTNMEITKTAAIDNELQVLTRLMQEFKETENQLLSQRKKESEESTNSTVLIIVAGNMLGFAMLLLTFWLLKRQNEQRSRLESALQKSNNELEMKVAERTQELAQVNDDLTGLNITLEQRIIERTTELESFSYSISHDLRAPLRAIDGFGLMLEEDCADTLDANGRRYLSVIRGNSQRMGNLIDDLLAFSRLGRQSVNKFSLDMTALVKEVIEESLQDTENPPEIRLDTLPVAQADRALLKQVWINLISNAIKYSSKSEQAIVHISGEMDGNEAIYLVKDNGVGFNMEYYNKLFGVFQRLHHVSEFSGTGVGLAISQRILMRHGGRIWAESKLNEGASFFFALPTGEQNG
ncbi:sensor histidine kinase [Undibacterium sp. TJN19]|uniref:sensor histidine kinase n=1 Tax=Undibacterium sp. TJN19 TaxID=3413055 RepID=UPI003BF4F57C